MPATLPFPPAFAPDASCCPLCGAGNSCAMQARRDGANDPAEPVDCWCMHTGVAPAALARIPGAARGLACVCARCAQGEARG